MDMNPNNPYGISGAAVWYKTRTGSLRSGPTSGIYKSTHGGNTWTLVSGAGSGFAEGVGKNRAMCIPQNQTLFMQ